MSGGKGGTKTSTVEIPEYIERAAQRNLNRAEQIAQMGYVPYYGPDVAAFTPMQEAAMQNVASAASAFGLATPTGAGVTGMPAATEYAGGIRGYSSAPMFEQAQAELAARRPAQKSYIDSFFIDPVTGQYGANAPALVDYTAFGTAADERAAQRANELAIAQAGSARDPYNGGDSVADFLDPNDRMGLQETMDRVNYAAADDAAGGVGRLSYGENEKGDIISIGFGANQVDPALAAAAGYTPREDNPFNYSFGDHMSKMGSDVKDIATQVASDVSKISPVANIIGLLSKDDDEPKSSTPTVVPKPKPKPKRDDSNDTPTVVPKPKPKPKRDDSNDSRISLPKPKPKPKPKKKKSGGGGR